MMFSSAHFRRLNLRLSRSLLFVFLIISISSDAANSIKYTYDALGRLTFVNDPLNGNRDYDYDKAGNRLLVSVGTATDATAEPGTGGGGTNHAPACVSPVITLSGIPSYASASFTVTATQVSGYCHDSDGDTVTVTSPTLPAYYSISSGQTIKISFAVSDGKGGVSSGTITYYRP